MEVFHETAGSLAGALALALLLPAAAVAADVKVGLMCPLTGKWASEGQDMKNIVSLLVDETNSKGGINGQKIELVVEDDAGDPRSAALAAQKLASAGVVAVIGTYGFGRDRSQPEYSGRGGPCADRDRLHECATDRKRAAAFLPHLPA